MSLLYTQGRGEEQERRKKEREREAKEAADPPPPPFTKWTRRVSRPVLIGHAASLTPY